MFAPLRGTRVVELTTYLAAFCSCLAGGTENPLS